MKKRCLQLQPNCAFSTVRAFLWAGLLELNHGISIIQAGKLVETWCSEKEQSGNNTRSLRETFSEYWEEAAALGISAAAFRHMTPMEVNVHVKGYEKQKKLQVDEANIYAWLIGAYVRIAVASTLDSQVDYPEKPYGLEEEHTKEDWQLSKMKMASFAAAVDKSLKNKACKSENNN